MTASASPTIPEALRDLWRQRAQLLASTIATKGRDHRELAHAASLIEQDYETRFVIELVQNANDQALRGGVINSTVMIVRTESLLAVSNGGQVVTAENLRRLSSLADSDKTGALVGNKGVGFKAVYRVTDAPEVYSAADTGVQAGLFDSLGLGFALERRPFEHALLVSAVNEDVRAFFAENAGIRMAALERGVDDPAAAVRAEYNRVAGFKFPLPRGRAEFDQRVAELRIPEDYQRHVRTLVVLPLRDPRASEDTEKALDQLVGGSSATSGQAELGTRA